MYGPRPGGQQSGLGHYEDYLSEHADEEANNVFRVYARTKHYSKKEIVSGSLTFGFITGGV